MILKEKMKKEHERQKRKLRNKIEEIIGELSWYTNKDKVIKIEKEVLEELLFEMMYLHDKNEITFVYKFHLQYHIYEA